MSRPLKRGLDYFPHDTDTDHDRALDFIEAKHGLEAYGLWWKLLERIYGEEGYYMTWGERECVLWAKRVGLTTERIGEIIADCVSECLFDGTLLDSHGVLTSRGIQQRYLTVTGRRVNGTIPAELLLAETPLLSAESTQTKGNKTKEDKTLSPTGAFKGIHPGALGKFEEKIGREATAAELRSLRALCKRFPDEVCCLAISQAYVQINEGTSAPRNIFAFITTIAKAEESS